MSRLISCVCVAKCSLHFGIKGFLLSVTLKKGAVVEWSFFFMCPLFLTTRGTAAVFSLVRYVNTVTLWIHETAVTLNNRTGIPLQFFFIFVFYFVNIYVLKMPWDVQKVQTFINANKELKSAFIKCSKADEVYFGRTYPPFFIFLTIYFLQSRNLFVISGSWSVK